MKNCRAVGATLGKLDEFGQRYTVDISITGAKWKYCRSENRVDNKKASDTPALTTILSNSEERAKMKFQEYDLVRILKDCEEGVRKGESGDRLAVF